MRSGDDRPFNREPVYELAVRDGLWRCSRVRAPGPLLDPTGFNPWDLFDSDDRLSTKAVDDDLAWQAELQPQADEDQPEETEVDDVIVDGPSPVPLITGNGGGGPVTLPDITVPPPGTGEGGVVGQGPTTDGRPPEKDCAADDKAREALERFLENAQASGLD